MKPPPHFPIHARSSHAIIPEFAMVGVERFFAMPGLQRLLSETGPIPQFQLTR
jgi:hypothetical protein